VADAGSRDEERDHVRRDEKGPDCGEAPRDQADDERAAQRLEVLDHRHALFLDGRAGPGRSLKNPAQKRHGA